MGEEPNRTTSSKPGTLLNHSILSVSDTHYVGMTNNRYEKISNYQNGARVILKGEQGSEL
jgi:hypothetical protein